MLALLCSGSLEDLSCLCDLLWSSLSPGILKFTRRCLNLFLEGVLFLDEGLDGLVAWPQQQQQFFVVPLLK